MIRGRARAVIIGLVALAASAAGCGGSDAPDATPPPSASDAPEGSDLFTPSTDLPSSDEPQLESMSVGVVAPSAADDHAFTQSIADSLERLADERPLEVALVPEVTDLDTAESELRSLAETGTDLVIAHGSQFAEVTAVVAAEFPDTSFAVAPADEAPDQPNVWSYAVRADEGGYVNGVVAAALTTTGVTGVVGPLPVGDAQRYVDGYLAGVAGADAAVRADVTYIESFDDVVLAREAANAHAAAGADVLTGTAQLVPGSIEVAAELGLVWLGNQSDQAPLAPSTVAVAQVYHWDVAVADTLQRMAAGEQPGDSPFELTLANGGLEMAVNDAHPRAAEVRPLVESTVAALVDGTVSTGVD